MAFNRFMHPRNIYRQKPNYEEMAKVYPEFASHLVYDDSKGKYTLDFSDVSALRSLTKTLLAKDFNLDVEIPEQRLVPTLPMRLNYILWIEDLLQHSGLFYDIRGLDIGTGSCAIFPLLATIMNKDWKFLATDIDPVNLKYASLNVNKNNLQGYIKIRPNNSGTIFKHLIENPYNDCAEFHFLMTNPPFFEDTFNDSFDDERKERSPGGTYHCKRTNSACSTEAVCDGGELQFIKQIVEESLEVKTKIHLYTAMIGRKKTFLELKSMLKDAIPDQVASFTWTELCQGNTKRWAIAWTFSNEFKLSQAPRITSIKGKPLIYYLPRQMMSCSYDMKSVSEFIKQLLINDLKIENIVMIETRKKIEFDIKSNEFNWRHQRRKRRQQNREELSTPKDSGDDVVGAKRTTEQQEEPPSSSKRQKTLDEPCKVNLTYALHCGLTIKRHGQEIYIKMISKEMAQNKTNTYQLFQYFKNKLY